MSEGGFDLKEWFARRIIADCENQAKYERWVLGEPEPKPAEPVTVAMSVEIKWACPACGSLGFRKWPGTETWSCDGEACLMIATTEQLEAMVTEQLQKAFRTHGDALRDRVDRMLYRDQLILDQDWRRLAREFPG